MDLDTIDNRGCHNIAPIILGEAAYNTLENETFLDWSDFKQAVTLQFRLTDE